MPFNLLNIMFTSSANIIGIAGRNIVLNKLYGISFALIGIYFYNIGTDGKTIVDNLLSTTFLPTVPIL
jgi:hypothetical protein